MIYKIVTSNSASSLVEKVNKYLEENWKIVGSHNVVVTHQQNRFSGMQHKDTIIEREYSQTIINKNKQQKINNSNHLTTDTQKELQENDICYFVEKTENGFQLPVEVVYNKINNILFGSLFFENIWSAESFWNESQK